MTAAGRRFGTVVTYGPWPETYGGRPPPWPRYGGRSVSPDTCTTATVRRSECRWLRSAARGVPAAAVRLSNGAVIRAGALGARGRVCVRARRPSTFTDGARVVRRPDEYHGGPRYRTRRASGVITGRSRTAATFFALERNNITIHRDENNGRAEKALRDYRPADVV